MHHGRPRARLANASGGRRPRPPLRKIGGERGGNVAGSSRAALAWASGRGAWPASSSISWWKPG